MFLKLSTIPGVVVSEPTDLQNFCDAIADAVVTHIQTLGVVAVTVTGTVTSGAGAGGVVAGTGTGTVT